MAENQDEMADGAVWESVRNDGQAWRRDKAEELKNGGEENDAVSIIWVDFMKNIWG